MERKVIEETEYRGMRLQLIAKRLADDTEVYDVEMLLRDGEKRGRILQFKAEDLDEAVTLYNQAEQLMAGFKLNNIVWIQRR